jgi:hypothetical protein
MSFFGVFNRCFVGAFSNTKLVEIIHYDERYPGNHNIHMTRNPAGADRCLVYTDDGWDYSASLNLVIYKLCTINLEFMKQTFYRYIVECGNLDEKVNSLLRIVYQRLKQYDSSLHERIAEFIYSLTKTKIKAIEQSEFQEPFSMK